MSIENIKLRAEYLAKIRSYFTELNVLEVDTPLAYNYGVTDPFIDVFSIDTVAGKRYLQSSPEYAMKRLLAQGSGSIYQICKAFRHEPCSRLHSHEFTMLEWYRVGLDYFELMREIERLFLTLKPELNFVYTSYKTLFEKHYGFNPHDIDLNALLKHVAEIAGDIQGVTELSIADCLDILFSFEIEKKLSEVNTIYFVYDYTIHQSALARKVEDKQGRVVAARFEVFCNGLELANGYYELIDRDEQLKRFDKDLQVRKAQNKPLLKKDIELLKCLDKVPECSGVALGIERLMMSLEKIQQISELSIF